MTDVGELSITVDDLTTWAPILISAIALYYSRKAMRIQWRTTLSRNVESINIFIVEDGVEIRNPRNLPLVKASVSYHHKWYGTYDTEIHRSRLSNSELTITFPIGASRQKWIQQLKHNRTSADRTMQDLMVRPHHRKARKRMAGKIMIAETLITDAERIQWYLNTAGTKLRVPRRAIPRGLFFLLFRLRLIGYPVWRSLGSLAWCNVALAALIATIVYDHYFNEGQLLLRALLALGARRAE